MTIIRCLAIAFLLIAELQAQTIKRIDGSSITETSLTTKVSELMQKANVSGVAISVFNDNRPVYAKTFGYANVPDKKPLTSASVMYAASYAFWNDKYEPGLAGSVSFCCMLWTQRTRQTLRIDEMERGQCRWFNEHYFSRLYSFLSEADQQFGTDCSVV